MSSRENSKTFALRNAINFSLLPFIISLSKVVPSFVKCEFYNYFLYGAIKRIIRDKTFRQSLTYSKQSINVGSTFSKFKVEMQ